MKDKILMDNPNKLKITLVRYWRINFRYEDKLYSLQLNEEDYEYSVSLNYFKDNKWNYVDSINYVDLHDLHLLKPRHSKKFKNTIVYKHIDKNYFLKTLHKYGLIYVGDKVELEMWQERLKNNADKLIEIHKKYYEEIEKNNIFRSMIEKEIIKLINKISKEEK